MDIIHDARSRNIDAHVERAKEFAEKNPDYAINKAGNAIESVLCAYLNLHDVDIPKKSSLGDLIKFSNDCKDVQQIPKLILIHMHSVREYRNISSHGYQTDWEAADAVPAIGAMKQILKWFNTLPQKEVDKELGLDVWTKAMGHGNEFRKFGRLEAAAKEFEKAEMAVKGSDVNNAALARIRALEVILDANGGRAVLPLTEKALESAITLRGALGFHITNIHAYALEQVGERAKAKTHLRNAIKWIENEENLEYLLPEVADGICHLVSMHTNQEEKNEAEQYLTQLKNLEVQFGYPLNITFKRLQSEIRIEGGPEEPTELLPCLERIESMMQIAISLNSEYLKALSSEWDYLAQSSRGIGEQKLIKQGRDAYAILEELGMKTEAAFGYNNLAFDMILLEDYNQATNLLATAWEYASQLDNPNLSAYIALNKGRIFSRKGNSKQAERQFKIAEQLIEKYGDQNEQNIFNSDIKDELSTIASE